MIINHDIIIYIHYIFSGDTSLKLHTFSMAGDPAGSARNSKSPKCDASTLALDIFVLFSVSTCYIHMEMYVCIYIICIYVCTYIYMCIYIYVNIYYSLENGHIMKHPRISEHPCCLIRSLRIVFNGKEGELLPWYTPWPPIPCKQLTVHLVASNYSIDDIYIYPPVIKGGWKNPKLNGGFKFSEHHRTKWWMFKPRLEDPVVPDRCPVAKWILHPFQRIHELLEGNVRKTLSQLMMFNQD